MPVILGGALVEIIKWDGMGGWSVGAVIAGMIAAFISGYVAVRLMLKLFAKKSLMPFAAYVTVLAVLAFIFV
jgi:undecaprenyl-diphosphatase